MLILKSFESFLKERFTLVFIYCLRVSFILLCGQFSSAAAADKNDIAISALELSLTMAQTVATGYKSQKLAVSEPNQYIQLANQIKKEIEYRRNGSTLVQTNFNIVGSILTYAALTDPEPMSKATFAIAAYGTEKLGEQIGSMVLAKAEEKTKALLSQGLKQNDLTESDLKLKGEELANKIGNIRIGHKLLKDVLHDEESLKMINAQAQDIALNISAETLRRVDAIGDDSEKFKKDVGTLKNNLDNYQSAVTSHLNNVGDHLGRIDNAIAVSNDRLTELHTKMDGHEKALKALTQISYEGWSTSQKLAAVRSGILADLTEDQNDALVKSLEADQAREQLVSELQSTASDLGNLAAIAGDLGLSPNITKGLAIAQQGAAAFANFASGNMLGGVAGITALTGLGKPDAAAERHAALMSYLNQHFEQVNKKLDEIIELQKKTLFALTELAKNQEKFRQEALAKLNNIESAVLSNVRITQAVKLEKWRKCDAFTNQLSNSNGISQDYRISGKAELIDILGDLHMPSYASSCYTVIVDFLNGSALDGNWSGDIVSMMDFPTARITTDPETQTAWNKYSSTQIAAFRAASRFVDSALPKVVNNAPAQYMLRFSQPAPEVKSQSLRNDTYIKTGVNDRLDKFKCSPLDRKMQIISEGFVQFLCPSVLEGNSGINKGIWSTLLTDSAMLGPLTYEIINTGIVIAGISDFGLKKDSDNQFTFVKPEFIKYFSLYGPDDFDFFKETVAQGKGKYLLRRLMLLADAAVLQQGITYGDYTAQLIEETLYDKNTKALNTDLSQVQDKLVREKKSNAIEAMRLNPILARNVVIIALRHAIADTLGSEARAEAVNYRQIKYQRAFSNFSSPKACDESSIEREDMSQLFENWNIQYVVSKDQKQKDKAYASCPEQNEPDWSAKNPLPDYGVGPVVHFGTFYVKMPSPMALSRGVFEQPDSLKLALSYRDKVNQALIDRNIIREINKVAGEGAQKKAIAGEIAYSLVYEIKNNSH